MTLSAMTREDVTPLLTLSGAVLEAQWDRVGHIILLIPKFCPVGQRQRLTVNNSTLLVYNDSKKASQPIESPHSVPGPRIQQNSLFVAA